MMQLSNRFALALVLLAAVASSGATAQDAQEILKEIRSKTLCVAYLSFNVGADGRTQVAMTITDAQKRERTRDFTLIRRGSGVPRAAGEACGDTRYYLYFQRPADVNKMAFLVWTHRDGSDDRWMYLPGLDLVKRISASDERTSFVGSHFYYEDVAGRSVDADSHTLVETTENFYVVESKPKIPDSVEFSAYRMWVHRESFIPVKVEYLDRQAKPYRQYEALGVETIDNLPTVTKSRMRDLRDGGETLIEFKRVAVNLDLPEEIFSERYLRSPPRQHLR